MIKPARTSCGRILCQIIIAYTLKNMDRPQMFVANWNLKNSMFKTVYLSLRVYLLIF